MAGRRVLVAGSTGYLGKYIVRELKRRGHWVRTLARNPDKLTEPGPFLEPTVGDDVDEIFLGEATQPETLAGVCDGVDCVFSSVGITRQKDNVTFRDVDYQGNRNILNEALDAGVERFGFVSIFQPERLSGIGMVRAREDFVNDLRSARIGATVIRPTGFFSDMSEFFRMAQSGRVYLIGNGAARINPIHGADLADVCASAVESGEEEVAVGGPDTFAYNEIAGLAFTVLGAPPRITHLPPWLASAGVRAVRPFSRRFYEAGRFFTAVMQTDFVAPARGTQSIERFFTSLAARSARP